MFYFLVLDANGNVIGSHAYTENQSSPPSNEIACTQAQALDPASWAVVNGAVVAATPSLAQQATTLVNSGIIITSVGTSSLNGTYAVDPTSISHFMAEFLSLVATSAFCDGSQSVAWPDTTGGLHTFTVAQFKPFALAASAFVAGALKCINGSSTTLPPATVTIP